MDMDGKDIEVVKAYRYLGILIDDSLTFKPHVLYLVKKTEAKTGFLFSKQVVFFF